MDLILQQAIYNQGDSSFLSVSKQTHGRVCSFTVARNQIAGPYSTPGTLHTQEQCFSNTFLPRFLFTTDKTQCNVFCLFVIVWSWTSSCRRTSCSPWWRGSVPRRRPTSRPCLTPRRPTRPRPNASPKPIPRSTLAGNFGSFEKHYNTHLFTATGLLHPSRRQYLIVYPFRFFFFTSSRIPFIDLSAMGCWILTSFWGDRISNLEANVDCVENVQCHAYQKWIWKLFWINFFKQGVKLHQGRHIWRSARWEDKYDFLSIYLHIFF